MIGVFCLHILLGAVGFVATAAFFADILDDSCNLRLVAALRVNLTENGGAHGECLVARGFRLLFGGRYLGRENAGNLAGDHAAG